MRSSEATAMGGPGVAAAGVFPWRAAAWLLGAFTLAVGLSMVFGHLAARNEDPLNSSQLKDLKEQLRGTPADEALKNRIRALDLQLRERYFQHISRMSSGVWLLLAGTGLFIFTAGRAAGLSRKPVLPCLTRPDLTGDRRRVEFSRVAVACVGALAGVGFFWMAAGAPKGQVPVHTAAAGSGETNASVAGPDCASASELAKAWPVFRGPGGGGFSPAAGPVRWGNGGGALGENALPGEGAPGENIVWRVESPSSGFNSPLIFGDYIYFSGGNAEKLEVICLRLADGQIAWRQALGKPPGSPAEPQEIPESTGYSPSTMATDGRRVYAIFATGDLGTFTMDGKPAWSKGFGALKNPYGHAISLTMWQDRLIVQLDQGESDEGKSMLYALDGRAGKPVWQRPRKLGASWASPIVFEAAGKTQIVTLSLPWAIAYSAVDGSELWRVDCLNGEVTPSPIFAGGFLIVVSPSDRILAIRPDGTGDITKTHVAWSFDESIPDVTSPVSNGELVFMVTTSGTLTCLDIKDGKKLWEHEFDMDCHASPVIAGNRLYQFGQDGTAVVVEVAREYKEVFKVKMPDSFHASPAFAQDKMVLRGMTNIWCIGTTGKGN